MEAYRLYVSAKIGSIDAEAGQKFQPASAHEFAADLVPWILAGLDDRNGNVALPKRDSAT